VRVEEVAVPLREASFEAWWTRTASVAGPLATMLASMPATVKDALTERLRRSVEPYRTATGLELSGLVLVASASKPSPHVAAFGTSTPATGGWISRDRPPDRRGAARQ
jgi:hypothetical protein